jgi:hypothetical protein
VSDILDFNVGSGIEDEEITIIDNEFCFNFRIESNVKKVNENRALYCHLKVPNYWRAFIIEIHGYELSEPEFLIPVKYQGSLCKAVDAFLKRISNRHSMSITAETLEHLIVRLGSSNSIVDLVAFDFAFNNECKNTRVKRHYTRFDNESDIASKINEIWYWIESNIKLFNEDFCFPNDYFNTEGHSYSKPVGSGFSPDLQTVHQLIKELKARLIKDNKFNIKVNIDALVNYHNHYVTYISFMLLYTTGYRAIYDPLPSLDVINARHMLLTITDKDYLERISTRTIPLTNVFLQQAELYKQHVEALVPLLIAIEPSMASAIYKAVRSNNGINVSKYTSERNKSNAEHGPLFILSYTTSGYLSTKHIKPGWLEKQTKAFDLAINAGRHFLRSELSKTISDNELVDYFMEHARYRESPHSIKSSFNVQEASAELRPHLEVITEKCSWQAIPSMIA